jgi:hypothetical protein
MTDELTFDPLADLPVEMPQDNVREYGAALVRNGMSVDDVNRHLTARGAAPLKADSLEMATFKRDQLLADPVFADRCLRGEPGATSQIHMLDVRIAKGGGGNLTDRDPAPADYDLHVASHMADAPIEAVQTYNDGLAKLASDLKLPEANAKALVASHFTAAKALAGMTDDERASYGQEQTRVLHSALGADAETRMKAASAVLSKVSGRSLDLSKIVQSNGADTALTLLHQAEYLIATKRA